MSDEQPLPETLETIAEQIRVMQRSMDARFDGVDARITKEIGDLKSQLRTEIEAVRGDVKLVAEAVAAQTKHWQEHALTHEKLTAQVDNHDLRIHALERGERRG